MAQGDGLGGELRAIPLIDRVDVICDIFEAAWREGVGPRIEEYLRLVVPRERPAVFRALLALELELRGGAGAASLGEYLRRFPGRAGLIAALFSEPEPPARDGDGDRV